MRLALVQQHATPDKRENVARAVAALEHAAAEGADLVAFAELAFERFWPQRRADAAALDRAEAIDGPTVATLRERARALGVVVVPNLFERDGDRGYDTSIVIDADGALLGRQRMLHITEYDGFHEQGYYAPGDTGAPVFTTRAGRIGVCICYDRHYPEVTRALALAGAELIVVPQAGAVGEWPDGLYEAEMRVAAFQNGCFVALCNRVGKEEVLDFAGESFVCDPSGRVIARAPSGEDHLLLCDLDLSAVERSHAKRLFLRDRRPDLYREWFGG
ncbi:MAG: nitrilase-related carbon-nitrogen hydrolase [Planctomycetota bacterium JB042]